MDIHHLKIFLSVYSQKGFSKASENLNLTQPTISCHIKALEEELGFRPFDRAGRVIIPTREAKSLYPRALDIVEKFDSLRSEAGLLDNEMAGELTVGASTIPGTYFLPALACEFRKTYPKISFNIVVKDTREITKLIAANELMFGVVGAMMEPRQLNYKQLIDDELVLVANPSVYDKATISTDELKELPFIMREHGSGTRNIIERQFEDKGVRLRDLKIAAVLGSTEAVKESVKAGLGVTVISKMAINGDMNSGALRTVKIDGFSMRRPFYIITHKRRTLPSYYLAFIEHLTSKTS